MFSFIPGQSGLVRLLDYNELKALFLSVGEQSLCTLLISTEDLTKSITKNSSEFDIEESLNNRKHYFFYSVDDDFDSKGGETVFQLILCSESFEGLALNCHRQT